MKVYAQDQTFEFKRVHNPDWDFDQVYQLADFPGLLLLCLDDEWALNYDPYSGEGNDVMLTDYGTLEEVVSCEFLKSLAAFRRKGEK